jgi:hypothetical protein
LPKCPPPPLDNGNGTDWEALRQEFKFAVDLDAGPDGQSLIRIVRRWTQIYQDELRNMWRPGLNENIAKTDIFIEKPKKKN